MRVTDHNRESLLGSAPALIEKAGMSITGSKYLAQTARDRIAQAKAKIAASHSKLGGALDQLETSTGHIDAVASAIEQEAAELTAAAAQLTNGPPSDEQK